MCDQLSRQNWCVTVLYVPVDHWNISANQNQSQHSKREKKEEMKTKDNSKDDDYRACGGRKHLAPLEKYSEYSLLSISKNDVHLPLSYHVIPVVFCLHFLFCYAVTDKLCDIHIQGDFCEGNGCELPCECPSGSVDNNRGLGLCVGEEGNAVECAIPLHTRTRAHTHTRARTHACTHTHTDSLYLHHTWPSQL